MTKKSPGDYSRASKSTTKQRVPAYGTTEMSFVRSTGVDRSKRNYGPLIYSQALRQLRDNHREEFDAIWTRLLKESGMKAPQGSVEQRRLRALKVIAEHIDQTGRSPSSHYVGRKLKMSNEPIRNYMNHFIKQGILYRPSPHSIDFTSRGRKFLEEIE